MYFRLVGILVFSCFCLFQSLTAQVVNIEIRRIDAKKQGWQGYGEVCYSYLRNQNRAISLGTRFSLVYLTPRNKYLLIRVHSKSQKCGGCKAQTLKMYI
jgi:hypothetical protein